MSQQDDLKNRGMERSDVDARRKAVESLTETKLENIASYPFDPQAAVRDTHGHGKPFPVPLMAEDEALIFPGVFRIRREALRDKPDQPVPCHVLSASCPAAR